MKKILSMVLVLVLVAGIAVSGTMAYLTDRDNATNVFTVGDVDIELEGTFAKGVELLPGKTVAINPVIKNVGKNDAWVWLTYAVPTGLKDAVVFGDGGTGWEAKTSTVDGEYTIYSVLHTNALAAGTATTAAFSTVKLADSVDITPEGDWYSVVGGQTTDLKWNTDNGAPAVYVNAYAIQKDQFANVDEALEAYTTQWGKLNGEMEELTVTEVATADELTKAVAAGGVVVLTDDVELDVDNTITVAAGKSVNLNLNGNKLFGEADGTGNREMFLVKGNMTVSNGTVEVKATVNQAWNAMATAFDVTAGGELNLDGVNIDVSGTDMSFCVHLNNWGEVTLNVNNSRLTANYVAVRAFNSGYDMNNITIKNSELTGTNKVAFWVHNYTVEDFGGDADKAAAAAARLNLDILNGTNTLVGKEGKAIRYGMTNAIYYDANGNVVS